MSAHLLLQQRALPHEALLHRLLHSVGGDDLCHSCLHPFRDDALCLLYCQVLQQLLLAPAVVASAAMIVHSTVGLCVCKCHWVLAGLAACFLLRPTQEATLPHSAELCCGQDTWQ